MSEDKLDQLLRQAEEIKQLGEMYRDRFVNARPSFGTPEWDELFNQLLENNDRFIALLKAYAGEVQGKNAQENQ